jgi:hypothetical protein
MFEEINLNITDPDKILVKSSESNTDEDTGWFRSIFPKGEGFFNKERFDGTGTTWLGNLGSGLSRLASGLKSFAPKKNVFGSTDIVGLQSTVVTAGIIGIVLVLMAKFIKKR